MNKKLDFILCLFLGYIGIHKFYEKKILIGILYLFTGGLFFIGWIYDCIKLGIIISKDSNNTRNISTQENQVEIKEEINNTLINTNTEEKYYSIDDFHKESTTSIKKLSQKEQLASAMNPSPIWNEGTEAQQEFATDLVDSFCNRFAKYLCWGIKDHIIEYADARNIADILFTSIDSIDDAKWWCNKKATNDFAIASKLLEDEEELLNIIKKLKKEYN